MKVSIVLTALSLALILTGCTTTKKTAPASIEFSGFLTDYSQLEEGRSNFPVLSYVKPGLSLKGYESLLVEDPKILLSDESLNRLERDDLQKVVGFAYEGGRKAMGSSVKIVEEPSLRTLRIRWAITELQPASKMNVVTGLIPYAQLPALALSYGADTHLFVGKIAVEFEILDSVSGEVLMSGIDRRVGAQAIQNVGSTWGDVKDAFELWAERFLDNLTDLGFETQTQRDP